MKTFQLIKQAGLIALCLFMTSEVFAYERWGCRYAPSNTYTFNANPTGFGGSYSHWRTSFSVARNRVNKGGKFWVNQRLDNDSTIGVGNGESELWWVTSGCSATAYGTTGSGGCAVVEADIHFSNNSCVSYEDDMSNKTVFRNYGPGVKRTFETTAIHEIGHTAGLGHENDEYGIMGGDYTTVLSNGSALRSYISEDMNEGLLAIYGSRSDPRIDLSAAHWKYLGADGAYSEHERTKIYNSSGTVLPSSNYAGCYVQDKVEHCEQIYTVDQGQVIQAEFLFENISNGTQTAMIGYYLSTTDLITTTDTLLGTESITLTTSGTALPTKKTLTIPTNLNTNTTYFIGAIIDYTDALNESDEENNASYIPIKTSNVGGSSSGGSSSGGSSSGGSSSGGSSSGGSSSGGALTNGVPVTGLGAATGSELIFYIDVPSGATNLFIETAGGTGDVDMYVKLGSVPTDTDYDCRPYGGGNGETCGDAEDPLTTAPGRWYIRLDAYETFANVTLTASYQGGSSSSGGSSSGGSSSGGSSSGGSSSGGSSSGGSSSGGSSSGGSSSGGSSSGGSSSGGLSNGQTVTGLSASQGNFSATYYIDVPAGASNLSISISGGTGDADLHVKKGSVPTDSSYDCRPYDSGSNETCGAGGDALATSEGRFYINAKAYSTFSGVSLTASYTGGGSSSGGSSSGGSSSGGSSSGGSSSGGSSGGLVDACASEGPHSGSSLTEGDAICVPNGSSSSAIQYFYIQVPGGASSMSIRSDHGSGNGNLYYNASTWATSSAFTQSSTNAGNTESITVTSPASGYRFISVIGQQSGMTLQIDIE